MKNRALDQRAFCSLVPFHLFAPALSGLIVLSAASTLATAQENSPPPEPTEGFVDSRPASPSDAVQATGFWQRDTMTGDWSGLRTRLADFGISLGATETSEILGNVSGGVRTGAIFEGRLELDLDLDLDKAFGWHGGLFHANAYQIHGRGLSSNDLGNNLLDVSNIEATRATRLFDAYVEQSLFDDLLSVRIGQIAADDEFFISQYAGSTFVNATFGWPGLMSADLPSGGPAYPLATPGLRIKYQPNDAIVWQTGLFNGDPAGAPGGGNPQVRNPSGTAFSTDRRAFIITELAYSVAEESNTRVLPATYKLGAWYHSGQFQDQRFDQIGRSLADPASTGQAAKRTSDFGLYAIIDQMLWRVSGADDQGLAGFARLAAAPDDRNLVSFYVDAGLTYKAPFVGRDNDVVGVGLAFAKIGGTASRLDQDTRSFTGSARPVRDYEAAIELTYQYQAAPWWIVQPDLQYVIHPGGNVASPNDPAGATPIKNALVIGVRSTVKF